MKRDDLSYGLGGWDSLATRNAIHEASMEADWIAAERQATQEMLRSEFKKALIRGNAFEPMYLTVPASGVAPCFHELIHDSLDGNGLLGRAMQVLLCAANGKDVQADALRLLDEAAQRFAENECDYVPAVERVRQGGEW